MKILSVKEASELYRAHDLAAFFGGVEWQYPHPVPSYFLPKDSGAKIALARAIAYIFMEQSPAILWITETKIWPSAEHMDIFTRYRLSFGEARTLTEAPVHIFDASDCETFISIISLGLFFIWGFEIVSQNRLMAVTVSHDEWIEYRFARGNESVIPVFEKRLGALVETRT